MSGASEIFELVRDFAAAPRVVSSALYDVWEQNGEDFARDWANNARQTSGSHGRLYPDTIDSETRVSLDAVVEVGPNSGRPQGGMGPGFEFGSRNQPPHLDGQRALPLAEARIARGADLAIGLALP